MMTIAEEGAVEVGVEPLQRTSRSHLPRLPWPSPPTGRRQQHHDLRQAGCSLSFISLSIISPSITSPSIISPSLISPSIISPSIISLSSLSIISHTRRSR